MAVYASPMRTLQLHAVFVGLFGWGCAAGAQAQFEAAFSGAQGPKALVPLHGTERTVIGRVPSCCLYLHFRQLLKF